MEKKGCSMKELGDAISSYNYLAVELKNVQDRQKSMKLALISLENELSVLQQRVSDAEHKCKQIAKNLE